MPLIKTQLVNSSGIIIATSNGKTCIVTSSQILNHYTTSGNNKAGTIAWIGTTLQSLAGAEMFDPSKITVDFDTATGIPTLFEIAS